MCSGLEHVCSSLVFATWEEGESKDKQEVT